MVKVKAICPAEYVLEHCCQWLELMSAMVELRSQDLLL